MYEDDRQTALNMYSRIFDEIDDDQVLMQQLMSPTRQAVVIARAYDSKSKKLQVHSESRSGKAVIKDEGTPKFVTAIEQIEQEALELQDQRRPHFSDNQLSMFDGSLDAFEDEPGEDVAYEDDEVTEADEDASPDVPFIESDEEIAGEVDEPEDSEEAPSLLDDADEPEEEDPVDAFISGMTIEGIKEPSQSDKPVTTQSKVIEEDIRPAVKVSQVPQYYTERKAIVPLLILYILIAIPIGLTLFGLLLIPTIASLAVACTAIATGAVTLTAAFSGFAVFADILIVLGCALLLLAIGLLFLWLFVWFIGGAIVGMIKGIIHLGNRLCYKEVAA